MGFLCNFRNLNIFLSIKLCLILSNTLLLSPIQWNHIKSQMRHRIKQFYIVNQIWRIWLAIKVLNLLHLIIGLVFRISYHNVDLISVIIMLPLCSIHFAGVWLDTAFYLNSQEICFFFNQVAHTILHFNFGTANTINTKHFLNVCITCAM